MKHPYGQGFHTLNKCSENAPILLIERQQRDMKPTGLVIPCGDRHAADLVSSRLFFDGFHKDMTYECVTAEAFSGMSR